MTTEVFQALQNKLKIGNRRGVHLNAIPANSRYKLDIARLSFILKGLPEQFVSQLLHQSHLRFSFSVHDKQKASKLPTADQEEQLQKLTNSIETLLFQNEVDV